MSKRSIKKHNLDFEKTLPYFIDHIQCGKTLSIKVIQRIDLHKGVFFTLLPSNAELNRLFEFPYGGIIPPVPYGNRSYRIEGHSERFHPQQVITMDHEFSEFIAAYTQRADGNCAVVENYMAEVDDPHVNIENVIMAAYGKEVYYILDNKSSVKEIYKTIRKSSEVWHSLAVLTETKNTIPTPLKDETLDRICDNAKFVVTGAYDGEAYIFWEKL